jgi:hypothetical protein
MPNRSELALPAIRSNSTATAENAWLLVSVCATGAILSIYQAACAIPFDQMPTLIAQVPWG